MKHKTIAVIGLGQFGGTVAKMLASMDHEVLGVDIDPEVVQKISPFITHAIVADTTDEEAIKALALNPTDVRPAFHVRPVLPAWCRTAG